MLAKLEPLRLIIGADALTVHRVRPRQHFFVDQPADDLAVLEVRSREVPFILEHGQIVGRLVYEKMLARPDAMYGQRIGSNYQAQGLKLSKHFRV